VSFPPQLRHALLATLIGTDREALGWGDAAKDLARTVTRLRSGGVGPTGASTAPLGVKKW
jgi:hypothetical protein